MNNNNISPIPNSHIESLCIDKKYKINQLLSKTALGKLHSGSILNSKTKLILIEANSMLSEYHEFEITFSRVIQGFSRPESPLQIMQVFQDPNTNSYWLVFDENPDDIITNKLKGQGNSTIKEAQKMLNGILKASKYISPKNGFGFLEPNTILYTNNSYQLLNAPLALTMNILTKWRPNKNKHFILKSEYISPEVSRGLTSTGQDDAFSLANIACLLLQGKPAYTLAKDSPLFITNNIASPISENLRRSLSLQRHNRHGSAPELLHVFAEAVFSRKPSQQTRKKTSKVATLAGLIAGSFGVFLLYNHFQPEKNQLQTVLKDLPKTERKLNNTALHPSSPIKIGSTTTNNSVEKKTTSTTKNILFTASNITNNTTKQHDVRHTNVALNIKKDIKYNNFSTKATASKTKPVLLTLSNKTKLVPTTLSKKATLTSTTGKQKDYVLASSEKKRTSLAFNNKNITKSSIDLSNTKGTKFTSPEKGTLKLSKKTIKKRKVIATSKRKNHKKDNKNLKYEVALLQKWNNKDTKKRHSDISHTKRQGVTVIGQRASNHSLSKKIRIIPDKKPSHRPRLANKNIPKRVIIAKPLLTKKRVIIPAIKKTTLNTKRYVTEIKRPTVVIRKKQRTRIQTVTTKQRNITTTAKKAPSKNKNTNIKQSIPTKFSTNKTVIIKPSLLLQKQPYKKTIIITPQSQGAYIVSHTSQIKKPPKQPQVINLGNGAFIVTNTER